MPLDGTATAVGPAIVMPWLTRPELFGPVIGNATPLTAAAGTNATPWAVSDGGPWVAAYETPAVAASSASTATSMAGVGRRVNNLRMGVPSLWNLGVVLTFGPDAASRRVIPWPDSISGRRRG